MDERLTAKLTVGLEYNLNNIARDLSKFCDHTSQELFVFFAYNKEALENTESVEAAGDCVRTVLTNIGTRDKVFLDGYIMASNIILSNTRGYDSTGFMHTHPSGSKNPSPEDIFLERKFQELCRTLWMNYAGSYLGVYVDGNYKVHDITMSDKDETYCSLERLESNIVELTKTHNVKSKKPIMNPDDFLELVNEESDIFCNSDEGLQVCLLNGANVPMFIVNVHNCVADTEDEKDIIHIVQSITKAIVLKSVMTRCFSDESRGVVKSALIRRKFYDRRLLNLLENRLDMCGIHLHDTFKIQEE